MKAILLILLALPLFAFQSPTQPKPDKQKQSPEIQDLLLRIGALPVEMEADALLMLIDSGKLNPESVSALLDDLFIRSGRASMPSTVQTIYFALAGTGSRPGTYEMTSRILGVDQLTLQTRILTRLAAKDLDEAKSKFDTIRIPDPPQSCKDSFRPVLTPYYTTLFELYRKKVSGANEKTTQEATDWLLSHLGIRQAGQILPVSRQILKLTGNKVVYARASSRFAQDLTAVNPIFSEYIHSLGDISDAVIEIAKSNDLLNESNEALWRAFIGYNQRALAGVRCSKLTSKEVDTALKNLRTTLSKVSLAAESAAELLELEKIQPKSTDDAAPELTTFYDDPKYQRLTRVDFPLLVVGDEERRKTFQGQKIRPDGVFPFIPLEERKSLAWQSQAQTYLRKIEDFTKANEDEPLTHFSKVSSLYSSFIERLPPDSDMFPEAVSSYLSFLSGSPVLKQSPVLWLASVKILLRRGTLDERELGLKRLRSLIRSHGNQTLNTLLDADQFNPMHNQSNLNVLFSN